MSRTVRTTALAAVLLLAATAVRAVPSSGIGPPGLLDSVWTMVASWLSPVWEKEGNQCDPNGKPCPSARPAHRSSERTGTDRRGHN